MKRFAGLLLPFAAAVLALASTSQAQDSGPRPVPPRYGLNPVMVLVDSAQVLELSADQAAQVRAIAQELYVSHRPALDSLRRYFRERGTSGGMGRGEITEEQLERMRRQRFFMRQLRDDNRAAMDRAMALLTAEQRERAQAMLPPEPTEPGRGGPGGPPQS